MLDTIYSVGCNVPGCLPESPPVKVRTFREAAAYLAESLDYQADAHFEAAADTQCGCVEATGESCADARRLESDIEELVRLAPNLHYLAFGWQSYAIGDYVYWIVPTRADNLDCIACDNRAVGWVEACDVPVGDRRNPNELIPVCEAHAL